MYKYVYSGTSLLKTFGTLILVLITEVSSIQRSLNTLQYYTGTENGVLIIEVPAIQRIVIERLHCTCTYVQILIHVCANTYTCMYKYVYMYAQIRTLVHTHLEV